MFMNQMTTGATSSGDADATWRYGMTDALGRWSTSRREQRVSGAASRARSRKRRSRRSTTRNPPHHRRAVRLARLLEENRDKVEAMTAALLEWETIDAEQINDIMEGRPPRSPKSSPAVGGDSSGGGTTAEVKTGNAPAPASPA
jgi:cell division protease FtsH